MEAKLSQETSSVISTAAQMEGVDSENGEPAEATVMPSLEPVMLVKPSHEPNSSKSVASEVAPMSTFASSADSVTSQQVPVMASIFPATTQRQFSPVNSTALPPLTTNGETRLRWVDFRRHQQAYPPRMPHLPGIPSGFRNPVVANPTTTASPTSPQPTSPMYNPGNHHSFFGGSSSNPVGFAGSVIMDDNPFKTPNPNRRYNITRVERKYSLCIFLCFPANLLFW